MGVVSALRHSGLARKSLLSLVVLAYIVYVAGILLQVLQQGADQFLTDFPYVDIGAATVGLVVAGILISLFFVTEPPADEDEAEAAAEEPSSEDDEEEYAPWRP